MSDELSDQIFEFTYAENEQGALKFGQWTWRVIHNKREPVVKCPVCGAEMYLPATYTIASDGLVGSTRGLPLRCTKAPACTFAKRFLLKDFRAHSKMVD